MPATEARFSGVTGRASIIGLTAALAALCGPAVAQQAYGPSSGYSSPDVAMKNLHDALHLSEQQETAWQAYSGQMALTAQARVRQQAAQQMMPSLDSPHRMDLIEAEMRQELVDLHTRSQALKSLYAVLTPAQRQIFDQRTLPAQNDR
jgi:hypothetical protein